MKIIIMVFFGSALYSLPLFAQQQTYTVKPGENVNAALAADSRFLYSEFKQGNVFFRDETASAGLLNYNLLTGEMQFIDPKGDTLALANEATIKFVSIGNDTFFYDKNYLQLVAENPTAKLAKKMAIKPGDVKKEGGYGGVSSTSAISNISTIPVNGETRHLTLQQEITYLKKTTWFIGDAFNHFLPASKKNVVKIFGKRPNAVEQYLKDHKVSFDNEEDLKALIGFLNN